VFGCATLEDVVEKAKVFGLESVIDRITVPYLVLQGTEDWLGLKTATDTYDYAKAHGAYSGERDRQFRRNVTVAHG
jgi:hypothetical protein